MNQRKIHHDSESLRLSIWNKSLIAGPCSRKSNLAGSRSTPFGSSCGAFADVSAVELG